MRELSLPLVVAFLPVIGLIGLITAAAAIVIFDILLNPRRPASAHRIGFPPDARDRHDGVTEARMDGREFTGGESGGDNSAEDRSGDKSGNNAREMNSPSRRAFTLTSYRDTFFSSTMPSKPAKGLLPQESAVQEATISGEADLSIRKPDVLDMSVSEVGEGFEPHPETGEEHKPRERSDSQEGQHLGERSDSQRAPNLRGQPNLLEGSGAEEKCDLKEEPCFVVHENARPIMRERGGPEMIDITQIANQVTTIKVERVVGHGTKQILLEETKVLPAIKIVDIVASLVNVRSIVKNGKSIVQGTVHKQIYYIGTDDLEHHMAEDIPFGDLVEIVPIDPAYPAREGMNQEDLSTIENVVWEFDPATGTLTQKVIVALNVKVTETAQLPVALDPYGQWIKAQVVIGEGSKQKFIEERKIVNAVKIMDITASLTNMRITVKNGKVIVQGTLHKQIYYVGTDDLVHHLAEDIPFSDLVEVPPLNPDYPVKEGMNAQDHSVVDNIIWEFNPDTSELTQKVILLLTVKVTETEQIPVAVEPYGTWIYTDLVIGHGTKQRLIEETKTIPAIKIVDVVARVADVTSIVKNGKVIVQGSVQKQIFYVGTDNLVHHLAEVLPFSEMVEVTPINPDRPVVEGMRQQDHSYVENVVWEFDPATGSFTEKVIVRIDVKVTQPEQIRVASSVVG